MEPQKTKSHGMEDMFRSRLESMINLRHELAILSKKIDWEWLERECRPYYKDFGRPGLPVRLTVGLLLLKHMYALSDEEVCARWVENPYYQYFTGEEYFRHDFPLERSSLSHMRDRFGEEFIEKLLSESLRVAYAVGALRMKDAERVAVDTTVQEKAVLHPVSWKLKHRAIVGLGKEARRNGIVLRQSFVKTAKTESQKVSRYRHAKQFDRARKAEKKLYTYLGRLIRDVSRKMDWDTATDGLKEAMAKAKKIRSQKPGDKVKLLSWHAPEVECIGKGKSHKPYEFGCKVSLATNVNPAPGGHFILHTQALHGNPYDGHTLKGALENIRKVIGRLPERVYVDKGYKGHKYEECPVYISGQRRGVAGIIKKELRRRTVIEPVIGHAKHDSLLGRNRLKGHKGDRINATLSAAGYNLRRVLAWIRRLFCVWLQKLLSDCLFHIQNIFRYQNTVTA